MADSGNASGARELGRMLVDRMGVWGSRWPLWRRIVLAGGLPLAALGLPASAPLGHFAVYWVLLLIMPGLALLDLTFGRKSFGLLEKIPLAFCLSLLLLAIPGTLAYLFRLDLATVTVLLFGMSGLALVLYVIQPAQPEDTRTTVTEEPEFERMMAVGLVLVLGIAAVLGYRYAGYAFTERLADLWYHMAFVRKLFENGVADPVHPFLKGEGVEFIYGYNVWHLVLAVLARVTLVDPVEASAYAVPFMAVTYLLAIYPLGRALLGPRVALLAAFAYVLIQVTVTAMDAMIHMVKPSTIAIWVLTPAALTFLFRYLKLGERCSLWFGALINVVPAVLHVTESLSILWAFGLLMIGALLWSEDRLGRARLFRVLGVVGAVTLVALALKAPLVYGQSAVLSEYAVHQPVRLGLGLAMTDPYNTWLRDPVQIAMLLLGPLLFVWLRERVEVQLLLLVPLFHFMMQFNPVLATAIIGITGEVFLRKVLGWLTLLNVITLSGILYLYLPPLWDWLRRALGARLGRLGPARAGLGLAVGLAILAGGVAYGIHHLQSLTGLAQARLSIPERHALKGLFVSPIGMVALMTMGLAATVELLTGAISDALKGIVDGRRSLASRWPVAAMGLMTVALVLAAVPRLEARYTRPPDGPYPRDANAIIPGELAFLRDEVRQPAVVLVKPREQAFDVTTPVFFLQAFTRHYGVSMPDPDYKKTRSAIDYRQRFRDAEHMYSGTAGVEDAVEISRKYAIEYIVTSRDGDRLYQVLSSAPASFSKVYERDNAVIFKVRLERG